MPKTFRIMLPAMAKTAISTREIRHARMARRRRSSALMPSVRPTKIGAAVNGSMITSNDEKHTSPKVMASGI